jgi:hypothetical protein
VTITSWKDYGGFKPPSGHEQQGVLFKPTAEATGLAAQHRWPRGYTPERQAEVGQAIVPGSVGVTPGLPATHFSVDPQEKFYKGGHWTRSTPDIQAEHGEIARRRIIDTIARSGMPVEHLQPAPTFEIHRSYESAEALGSYRTPARAVPKTSALDELQAQHDVRFEQATKSGQIHISALPEQGGRMEGTLLHELGHHRSFQTGTEHSEYASPEQRGREEAYADAYMLRHHVPRRGQPALPNQSAYESAHTWARQQVSDPQAATQAYHHARYHSGMLTQKQQDVEAAVRSLPGSNSQPHLQGRLFARPIDRRFTDTERDYGQWGYQPWHVNESGVERMETVGLPPPPREQRMRSGHPFTIEDLGTPEHPTRELSEPTRAKLRQRWGPTGVMVGVEGAKQRWGEEHPELGWS